MVADRGMISAETMAELEARRLLYPGRARALRKAGARACARRSAPFVPLVTSRRGKEIDYEAKTLTLAGRIIVCRTSQEAAKDAADRASIVAALERQLAKGDKALVSNTGLRRYLKTIRDAALRDRSRQNRGTEEVRRHLRAAHRHRSQPARGHALLQAAVGRGQTFRTAKHLLSTRPIFHKLDETIRGHVFCSFLALVLKKALEDLIAAFARSGSRREIIADPNSLAETEIEHDGKHFFIHLAPRPAASLALRAAGVALPPTVREAAAS